MTTVIAALDNSAVARSVARTAAAIAAVYGAAPRAVHVTEDGSAGAEAAAGAAAIELATLRGPPVATLVRIAMEPEVQAMVLGARGQDGAVGTAGRTALQIITTVLKPLVIVLPGNGRSGPIRRVLVPLDGTPTSAAALAETIELARAADVEVVALHVHEERRIPAFSDQLPHEVDAWTEEFLARYCPPGDVRLETRVGSPDQNILLAAKELDVDLLALGWSQDLSPGRAAVVREALARSPAPVLLVPSALPYDAAWVTGP